HLLGDAWSTAALLAGLVAIRFTGLVWLDSVLAIAFALYIIVTGLRVFRRSVAGIMDEADLTVAAEVVAILESGRRSDWIDVHNFRVIAYGSTLHIDLHATLPWYYPLERAHRAISEIEALVRRRSG